MRNSFVMYTDCADMIEKLDEKSRSDLLLAIMRYQTDRELPEMSPCAEIAFLSMKSHFDKDNAKYDEVCEKRKEAGKLGGRPKKANALDEEAKKAKGFSKKQTKANESKRKQKNPDSDSDSDSYIDSDIDSDSDSDIDKAFKEKDTNVSKEKKSNKKENPVYYPNDEKLNQAFMDFIEMRKTIKKPMTDHAIDLAMNKLRKLSTGADGIMDDDLAIQILDQSTFKSWIGLFALADDYKQSSKSTKIDDWMSA